ncbi:hypothetical protein BH10BAC1_BH10BAC1_03350 [soil metagenome]
MKKLLLLLVAITCLFSNVSVAQGGDCNTADPFCTGVTYSFPASTTTTAPTGPNYGCLGSQPNPAFYYVQIATSGTLTIDISQTDASGSGQDVDFICWGPFTSPAAGCASGLTGSSVDCSYSTAAVEACDIPTAVAGEFYMLMLTNYAGVPADITFASSGSSTATTNCAILCNMTGLTAVPGPCNAATNTYTLTGTITYADPPTTGTLTITNSCTGVTQVINPPFPPTTIGYSLAGMSANGASCTVTAVFSADPLCTLTTPFTATAPCSISCSITALTANPGACDIVTNNYSVTGSISFVNPPAGGTLTVTSSCGGTVQVLNPPFISPLAYALNGLVSNGAACTVTAVFTADPLCTLNQNYTAPASCSSCPVTAGNNGPLCAGLTLNLTATAVAGATYSWTGPGGFVSALQNPSIPLTTVAMSGVYTVTVNVVGPPVCNASSSTTVTINAIPTVTVNSPATCTGISTTLTAAGATSYIWSTGAITNPITVPGTTTTYTVVGSTAGCTNSAVATVTTSAPPTVSFTGDTLSGCNPVVCNLVANTAGNPGATYTWNFGDGTTGTGPNITHVFAMNGCNTVTLTVSFGAGCSTTDSIPCMINVFPQPVANFAFSPTTIDILNPTAYFNNLSTNSTQWLWNFGDSTSSTSENPSHTWDYIGVHPVTLYATTVNGCIDSIEYIIIIDDIITAYIPNTFTPNGDGVNDLFNIYSNGISPDSFEMLVFDRWGNKIYNTRNINEGWNGAVNNRGTVCQEDVYVYRFNYKDIMGKKHKAIGHVTIVK